MGGKEIRGVRYMCKVVDVEEDVRLKEGIVFVMGFDVVCMWSFF